MALAPTLRRFAAAVLVTAAASLVVPTSPAAAAACSGADGVTVVVDFNELGGGVQQICDPSGGGADAAALFDSNGFPLSYAQRQPGFVCRVSGVPVSDPCQNPAPADAYWSLYWSDGTNGSWVYASLGAGSLVVPNGGYVGFSWKQGNAESAPSTTPTAHGAPAPAPSASAAPQPSASPTKSPTTGPTKQPSTSPTKQPGGSPTKAPTGSPTTPSTAPTLPVLPSGSVTAPGSLSTASPSDPGSASPSATPSASASTSTSASSGVPGSAASGDPSGGSSGDPDALVDADPAAASSDAGGLPGWVAPSLIGLLFVLAGAVAAVRHRRGTAGS